MPNTPPRRSKRNKDNEESTTEQQTDPSEPRSSSQSYSSALEGYSTPEETSTDFDFARLDQLGESSSPPLDTNQNHPSSFRTSFESAIPTRATAVTTRSAPSGLNPEGSSGDSSVSSDSSVDSSIGLIKQAITTMAPTGPNSKFDAKMTFILEDIFPMKESTHPVRRSLNSQLIHTYETFRDLEPLAFYAFQYENTKATSSVPAIMLPLAKNQAQSLLCCNAYARFLEDNGHDDLADDPSKWDLRAFGKWRRKDVMPYVASLSTISTTTPSAPFVATPAVTAPTVPPGIPTQATTVPATTATVPTTAPAPVLAPTTNHQKIDDDSLTGWKRKNLNVADYPKLTNDTNYVPWKIKFTRQVSSHFWFRLIDPNFSTTTIRPGVIKICLICNLLSSPWSLMQFFSQKKERR